MNETAEIFGNIIFAYTDKEAVDDGVLIDVAPLRLSYNYIRIDRVTAAVWAEFERLTALINEQATRQRNVAEMFFDAIKAKLKTAVDKEGDGYLITLPKSPGGESNEMWLVLNERDHYTLMFPSDY